MNTRLILSLVLIVVLLTNVGGATAHYDAPAPTAPQTALGTAFTYQGQIDNGGSLINGPCDFQFSLYDASSGGIQIGTIQTSNGISVTNGLFTVSLDFGIDAFNGDARWLDMTVRCPAGSGSYTPLTPRQALTPVPYASFSSSAPWGGVSGVPSPIAFLGNPSPCSNGQLATWNGTTWTCAAATTYSAGAGLALNGNLFSVITSTVQQRVSGSCAVGSSSVHAINADGTVDCWSDAPLNRAAAPAANTATTVDSAGSVGGSPSVTIGADGLPVASYDDYTNRALKMLHCGNALCSNGNIRTTVDSTAYACSFSSIALEADGLPVISYVECNNYDLKILHCGNALCNSGNISTTVDSAGSVGNYNSIALGADGLPVVSYYDETNLDLKVLHCGNALCNSGNISTTVDSTGSVGTDSSVTIGADGLPVISYYDYTNGDLKVLHCGNAACNSGNISTTVDSAGNVGRFTSVTIGADGLPVVSYSDYDNGYLKVLHCGNALCNSGNISTTVDSAYDVGQYSSITIGADGLPVVSYSDLANLDLKVLHCGNALCNSGNISTTVDSAGSYDVQTSITIGADGLPMISSLDDANIDLEMLHCSNVFCTPYFRRR